MELNLQLDYNSLRTCRTSIEHVLKKRHNLEAIPHLQRHQRFVVYFPCSNYLFLFLVFIQCLQELYALKFGVPGNDEITYLVFFCACPQLLSRTNYCMFLQLGQSHEVFPFLLHIDIRTLPRSRSLNLQVSIPVCVIFCSNTKTVNKTKQKKEEDQKGRVHCRQLVALE